MKKLNKISLEEKLKKLDQISEKEQLELEGGITGYFPSYYQPTNTFTISSGGGSVGHRFYF